MSEKKVILTRQELYDEIWTLSISGVSRKYKIPYSQLIGICKRHDIPTPSSGYWIRIEFGKNVSEYETTLSGSGTIKIEMPCEMRKKHEQDSAESKSSEGRKKSELPDSLSFLDDKLKRMIANEINRITIRDNGRLHKTLTNHKREAFKESQKIDPYMGYPSVPHVPQKPFDLARQVSPEGMTRVYRIADAVFRSIEKLGGSPSDNLAISIGNETLYLEFKETKTDKPHIVTEAEKKALKEYNDRKKDYGWYRGKPNIRKYDHVYNGKLALYVRNKAFRDSPECKIEDRLDEILISVWECYHDLCEERLEREARERAEAEAKRLEEERLERIEEECDSLQQLLNEAEDYRIACVIRAYAQTVEMVGSSCKSVEWIKWAKEKADWFDPLINKEDPYLGKREPDSDNRNSPYDIIKRKSGRLNSWYSSSWNSYF